MKKHVEIKGEPLFNWSEALSKENITQEEWDNMKTLAGDFVTCACGNLCSIIPRNEDSIPEDEILKELGNMFYETVKNQDETDALQVLSFIETRAAYLIDIELMFIEVNIKHKKLLQRNNLL